MGSNLMILVINTMILRVNYLNYFSCINGGECIDGIDDFTCSCPPGLTGTYCECLQLSDDELNCNYTASSTTPSPSIFSTFATQPSNSSTTEDHEGETPTGADATTNSIVDSTTWSATTLSGPTFTTDEIHTQEIGSTTSSSVDEWPSTTMSNEDQQSSFTIYQNELTDTTTPKTDDQLSNSDPHQVPSSTTTSSLTPGSSTTNPSSISSSSDPTTETPLSTLQPFFTDYPESSPRPSPTTALPSTTNDYASSSANTESTAGGVETRTTFMLTDNTEPTIFDERFHSTTTTNTQEANGENTTTTTSTPTATTKETVLESSTTPTVLTSTATTLSTTTTSTTQFSTSSSEDGYTGTPDCMRITCHAGGTCVATTEGLRVSEMVVYITYTLLFVLINLGKNIYNLHTVKYE